MNFFAQQDQARKRTFLLVVYFILAVVLIIVAMNAAVYMIFSISMDAPQEAGPWFAQPYWIWITSATVLVILFGTMRDLIRLGGGGTAVAEMVGARRISSSTKDPDERKLVNVVEEMSIASGTPRPALYVMDNESAINAFVAGYRPTEAVLVVTRGSLEKLSRDELQGVVGHEYSHILNGDMRLNIRLWGIVSGILLIGQIGYFLLRSLRHSGRGSGRGKGKGVAIIIMLGLALFIIGYIGLFFGRLIKAAVSRQREFLADASSVQFTRNPDGIAGALWKIKQNIEGSLLLNKHAEDMSHLCFGTTLNFHFENLFATHPPLEERIQAVNPGFIRQQKTARINAAAGTPAAAVSAPAMRFTGAASSAVAATPEQVATSIGSLAPVHMDYAAALHAAMPATMLEALHDAEGAARVIYGLLLAGAAAGQQDAIGEIVRTRAGEDAVKQVREQAREVSRLGAGARLPVINLAMPALKELDQAARETFLETVTAIIHADRRFTLFEFTLLTLLQDHLSASAPAPDKVKYFKYEDVLEELRILFTVLARAGTTSLVQIQKTFRHVMGTFSKTAGAPAPDQDCTVQSISAALKKLDALSPLLKQSVITACTDCVVHDGMVQPAEGELLQAIAVSLDCPMPPLVQE
ncbi:MAG: M48 family metallopeptidase [Gammaproteobacteria bacterium]